MNQSSTNLNQITMAPLFRNIFIFFDQKASTNLTSPKAAINPEHNSNSCGFLTRKCDPKSIISNFSVSNLTKTQNTGAQPIQNRTMQILQNLLGAPTLLHNPAAKLGIFNIQLHPGALLSPYSKLSQFLATLPDDQDQAAYQKFIVAYGTHLFGTFGDRRINKAITQECYSRHSDSSIKAQLLVSWGLPVRQWVGWCVCLKEGGAWGCKWGTEHWLPV